MNIWKSIEWNRTKQPANQKATIIRLWSRFQGQGKPAPEWFIENSILFRQDFELSSLEAIFSGVLNNIVPNNRKFLQVKSWSNYVKKVE